VTTAPSVADAPTAAVASGAGADPAPEGAGRRWVRLAAAGLAYLAASFLLWWHVWTAPGGPSSVMTCACTDAGRSVWSLEWSAFALAHGHRLLFSTSLFHPTGFNLLTDTTTPAVGLVSAPVTWAAGPVVAFNLAVTLAPALTALSMCWLLQRWVRWTPAAFVGGLAYGFSAFVVVQLAFGWLNLALLALLPLMAACLDDLLVRRRRSPVRVGAVLGLLVAVEFFISSELVLVVVVSGLVATALVAVHAWWARPPGLRAAVRHAVIGAAAAAGVATVLLAWPVWSFLAGPGHLGGTLWSTDVPGALGTSAGNLWSRLGTFGPLTARQLASEAAVLGGYRGSPVPSPTFVGVGVLAVAAVGTAVWRRDRRLWLFGSLAVATFALGLRTGGGRWAPWAVVDHLPIFRDVLQYRFAAVTDLCLAVMVAVVVDRTRSAVAARRDGSRSRTPGAAAGLAVAAVALVPVAAALAPNLPLTVQTVSVPAWFRTVAPTLPPGRVLATYPFATADSQASIPWQAIAGMPYAMAGGGGPTGTVARAGDQAAGFAVLRAASTVVVPPPSTSPAALAAVRRALEAWGVTTVVVPDDTGLPVYQRGRGTSYGVAFYTAVLGTAPVHRASAWVWPAAATDRTAPVVLAPAVFSSCAGRTTGAAAAACVLAPVPPAPGVR
jgi:hypothetical protein